MFSACFIAHTINIHKIHLFESRSLTDLCELKLNLLNVDDVHQISSKSTLEYRWTGAFNCPLCLLILYCVQRIVVRMFCTSLN